MQLPFVTASPSDPTAGRRRSPWARSPSFAQTSNPNPSRSTGTGFRLNAAVSCQPHQRDRLERLCRYITRPPLALDRLTTQTSGQVVYELKHPFKNGTTHFVFEPMEFLAKLAALIPRPRANLTRYHGVLAPNAKFRSLIVPTPNARQRAKRKHSNTAKPSTETDRPLAPLSWAERLKRVFKIDIELCPKCGGRLRVIAAITEPNAIQKILDHVHQQQAPPRQRPGRANGPIISEIQFDAS